MSSISAAENQSINAPDDALVRIVLSSITDASNVARHVQSRLDDVREMTKNDRSPVTVADFAVQAIISLDMNAHDPSIKIVGEEDGGDLRKDSEQPIRDAVIAAVQTVRPNATCDDILDAIDACDDDATSDSYWTLDPVDGTKGFLRGQQYAIAFGRIDRGRVTLGFMGCPNLPASQDAPLDSADATGCVYMAALGHGAWRVVDDEQQPIQIATGVTPDKVRACGSVEKAHSSRGNTERILDHLGSTADLVRLDSQCKYAVVARGQADAYLRLPVKPGYEEKIWDHAAGMLIAAEAGAVVSDIHGKPLDFGQGPTLKQNRGVICAGPACHAAILTAIEELCIGKPT